MAVSTQNVSNPPLNDPVTKAVVDNIMGNLPTKKPLVKCEDCDLSFTSQTVLDAHLQGARHAKQIRSKTIMATLEETKVAFTKDQETNGLKCNVCNVCLNSMQQLQTHLNGSRHKKKASKGGWAGKEEATQGSATSSSSMEVEPIAAPVKSVTLTCDTCNKFFNSQAQYNMHVTSKKHVQKAKLVKKQKKKRFSPYWKKPKPYGMATVGNQLPAFANNYVAHGYVNFA